MGGLFKVDPYELAFTDVVSIYEGCF
jgi:hypothetical protein